MTSQHLTLAQWLQHLETLHPRVMELGLERVSSVARALGLLPVGCPVVTVAGTNGKGSTVAVLESLLVTLGRRPGCYTSPHLQRFNERIRIAGTEAPDDAICAAFSAIENARQDISLTYFEFATLAALWLFRQQGCDVVVLEVGLGGRLDAANMVDADIAVITSIDLDHQEWLGDTREVIGREKAGIMRADAPVVVADPHPPASLASYAAEVAAGPLYGLGSGFGVHRGEGGWHAYLGLPGGDSLELPTQPYGALLPENVCAALQAGLLLGLRWSEEQLARALERAQPEGRREPREHGGRTVLLDVAHNPAAVNKLAEYIDATPCKGKEYAIFSVMADKAVAEMLANAEGLFAGWFLPQLPGNPRALPAGEVAALLPAASQAEVCADPATALAQAWAISQPGDRLCVFGSFFTVAAVMPLIATLGADEGVPGSS